jgi:hypothetical protein
MGNHRRTINPSRQPRKENAPRFYYRGWIPHHPEMSQLSAAVDCGRSVSTLRGWVAEVCGVEKCGGEEEVEGVCGLGNFRNASIAEDVKL